MNDILSQLGLLFLHIYRLVQFRIYMSYLKWKTFILIINLMILFETSKDLDCYF
jgi:hypothetical protein